MGAGQLLRYGVVWMSFPMVRPDRKKREAGGMHLDLDSSS